MMNEIERAELEAENDGFRNEYQRAAAVSAMQPVNDDRARAGQLVANGLNVAVAITPRYCRLTDAVIGEHVTLLAFGDSRDALLNAINREVERNGLDETSYQIWPLSDSVKAVLPVRQDDDQVPF